MQTATEPVAETLQAVTTPVADTVQAVSEPVAGAAGAVATPVLDTVQTATEPVAETLQAVTTPVAETVQTATEPVAETLQAVTTAVADTTTPLVQSVDTTPPPLADPSAAASTVVPIVPVPAVEPTLVGLDPSAVAPPPGLLPIEPGMPAIFPDDVLHPVTDSSSLVLPSADALTSNPTFLGGVFDDVLDGVDVAAGVLPVAAAVGLTAVTAASIARGVLTPSAAVMFTNVRLLPCVVGSTIERTSMAAAEAMSGLGSHGGGGSSERAGSGIVREIVDPLREGFDRAVARPSAEAEDLKDGRLLVQIGVVLGVIYLAFLTAWFWATRLRWSARA